MNAVLNGLAATDLVLCPLSVLCFCERVAIYLSSTNFVSFPLNLSHREDGVDFCDCRFGSLMLNEVVVRGSLLLDDSIKDRQSMSMVSQIQKW